MLVTPLSVLGKCHRLSLLLLFYAILSIHSLVLRYVVMSSVSGKMVLQAERHTSIGQSQCDQNPDSHPEQDSRPAFL